MVLAAPLPSKNSIVVKKGHEKLKKKLRERFFVLTMDRQKIVLHREDLLQLL